MASYDELMSAARRADQAGDEQAAKRFLELAAQLRGPAGGVSTAPGAVDDFEGKIRAVGRGAAEGVTYGFKDNASAALGATLGLTPGSDAFEYQGNWRDRYRINRDNIRAKDQESLRENPNLFQLGEFGGATAQALAASPLAASSSLLGAMGRGGALGFGEGFAYGAGKSDGQDTARRAFETGILGGAVGLAAPAAVAGLAAGKDAALGAVDNLIDRPSQARAGRMLAETINRSGKSADEIAAAVERARLSGQPMYRAVDAMGEAGRRRLSGIVRSGGENADEIAEYLTQRTIDAPDRLASFTDDAFGLGGKTRAILEGQVKGNRKAVADSLYTTAAKDAAPVDLFNVVATLDDTINQLSNSGIKPSGTVRAMTELRDRLAGQTPDGANAVLSDYRSVLQIYRELRDEIDNMFAPGSKQTAVAAELKPILDMMEGALSDSSDLFRSANQLYRRGSEVIEGFQTGADMARQSGRPENNIATFNAADEQVQRAQRIGYGDETIRRIQNMNAEAPNVSRQMASTKRRTEAMNMALNPEQYAAQIAREGDMFKTFNKAIGGSRTADNLQDIADVGTIADLSRAGVSAASGSPGGFMSNVLTAVTPYLRGQNEATQKIVAQALLSRNPGEALAKAVRAGKISGETRRAIEAAIRSAFRVSSTTPEMTQPQ